MLHLNLPGNLSEAVFLRRLNRFAARVLVNGEEALAHVPSSGRMSELLVPGATVYLQPVTGRGRRTDYKLLLVDYCGTLVSVDSLLPNRLLGEAFRDGSLPEFAMYDFVRPEFPYRDGRIDFFLSGKEGRCLVEVKSVTLVQNGEARFPDAPSQRGARHVRELADAVDGGYRARVIFVVQRDDAVYFTPNDRRDPEFGAALRDARRRGVEVMALGCRVGLRQVRLLGPLPVVFF